MADNGIQFLHESYPALHTSEAVENTVRYLDHEEGLGAVLKSPEKSIAAYLGFLADPHYVNDGIFTGDDESITRQIDPRVIAPENVPESFFDAQRRMLREQGHGDVEIPPIVRREHIATIRDDQRESLSAWAEYLGSNEAGHPDWFRYHAWESVQKLGGYNPEQSKFSRRTKGTVAPYPEVNGEALAYVYDQVTENMQSSTTEGKVAHEPASQTRFDVLYANAVKETTVDLTELRKNTKGAWVKYDQIQGKYIPSYAQDGDGEYIDAADNDVDPSAAGLARSLRGKGTGWCTAGSRTAAHQLSVGDFYVYYSQDQQGSNKIPRVAVRMQQGRVAEVRGVEPGQALEPEMAGITSEKLAGLPGGEVYQERLEDMQRVTGIEQKNANNEPLTKDDLRFLYEFDKQIQGFGYGPDPRVREIVESRATLADMEIVFETTDRDVISEALITQHAEIALVFIKQKTLDQEQLTYNELRFLYGFDGEKAYRLYNGVLSHDQVQDMIELRDIVADMGVLFGITDRKEVTEKLISEMDRDLTTLVLKQKGLAGEALSPYELQYVYMLSPSQEDEKLHSSRVNIAFGESVDRKLSTIRRFAKGGDIASDMSIVFGITDKSKIFEQLVSKSPYLTFAYIEQKSEGGEALTPSELKFFYKFGFENPSPSMRGPITHQVMNSRNFLVDMETAFNTSDKAKIIEHLLEDEGLTGYLFNSESGLGKLSNEVAYRLIDLGWGDCVLDDVAGELNFPGLKLDAELAEHLIAGGINGSTLMEYIDDFEPQQQLEVVDKLLSSSQQSYGETVRRYLHRIKDVKFDINFAKRLVDAGADPSMMGEEADLFRAEDHVALAELILQSGRRLGSGEHEYTENMSEHVAWLIGKFNPEHHLAIANLMVDTGQGGALFLLDEGGIDKFNLPGVPSEQIERWKKGYDSIQLGEIEFDEAYEDKLEAYLKAFADEWRKNYPEYAKANEL